MNNEDLEIERFKRMRQRRNRLFLMSFVSLTAFIIGLLFLFLTSYVSELLMLKERAVIILGIALLIGGLGILLSAYLNSRPLYFSRKDFFDYEDIDLNTYFNRNLKRNLFEKYGSLYPRSSSEEGQEKPKLFETDLTTFKNKFVEQSLHDLEFANLFDELYKLDSKIKSQIDRLETNSNLNLIIGIITTAIAILLLGASIFNQKDFQTPVELASHYIPRISTVIFVELFSFFFLKLYKNNLSEIKYFQNEITNLNFKISALKTAIKTKDNPTIFEIVKTFATTERNFILKKDESTEKIEIKKTDASSSNHYFQSLTDLVKSIKK